MERPTRNASDLGKRAEHFFDGMCIGWGRTTRPEADEFGWDRFVDVKAIIDQTADLDAQPSPLKLLVQVKGTEAAGVPRIAMKLSNWVHLSTTPLPAFVAAFQFAGPAVQRGYLCHIDESRIASTLKRVRQADASGRADLHNITMYLVPRADEELKPLTEDTLQAFVIRATGNDAKAYALKKSQFLTTTGFETGAYKVSVSVRSDLPSLVQASLGIGTIEAASVKIYSSRFDIPKPLHEYEGSSIEITPEKSGTANLIARSASRCNMMQAAIVTPGIPGLPRKEFKIRIHNPFINLLLGRMKTGMTYTFDIKLDPQIPQSLNEMLDFFLFVQTLSEPEACFSIEVDNKELLIGRSEDKFVCPEFYKPVNEMLRVVRAFLDKCGFRSDIQISLKSLTEQSKAVADMRMVLDPHKTEFYGPLSGYEEASKLTLNYAKCVFFCAESLWMFAYCMFATESMHDERNLRYKLMDADVDDFRAYNEPDWTTAWTRWQQFEKRCRERTKGLLMFQNFRIEDDGRQVFPPDDVKRSTRDRKGG